MEGGSIYQTIANVDGNTKVIYLGTLVLVAFSFATWVGPVTANGVIGVILGLCLVYYLNDKAITSTESFETDLYYKLQTLSQVDSPGWSKSWPLGRTTTLPQVSFSSKYMYLDPDLIILMDSIKNDLGASNLDNYVNTLRCIENVLHLRYDVVESGTPHVIENAVESYEVAEDQMKAALNYANGFALADLDSSPVLRNKHTQFMKRFHLLLQRNLDLIKDRAQQIPLNSRTKFITDFNGPVAYDKAKGFTGISGGGGGGVGVGVDFNVY